MEGIVEQVQFVREFRNLLTIRFFTWALLTMKVVFHNYTFIDL